MNKTKRVVNKLLEGKPVRKVLESDLLLETKSVKITPNELDKLLSFIDGEIIIKADFWAWKNAILDSCPEVYKAWVKDNVEPYEEAEWWLADKYNFRFSSINPKCGNLPTTVSELEAYMLDHCGDESYSIRSIYPTDEGLVIEFFDADMDDVLNDDD